METPLTPQPFDARIAKAYLQRQYLPGLLSHDRLEN